MINSIFFKVEESSLKNISINKFIDIKSQRRSMVKKGKEGIFFYLRKISLVLVKIFPMLKSCMIIVVQKRNLKLSKKFT